VCTPLLSMDADTQPDIGAAIAVMKQVEQGVNKFDPTILDHALVLLGKKQEYTTPISPIAFIRSKNGEYSRTQLPDDFSTKIICGDAADEMEVIADGSKHHFFYSITQKLMALGKVGDYMLLFQNGILGTVTSNINDQPHLSRFFSLPQTSHIPVQKLYPYGREINAQLTTKHNSLFRMPETSGTAVTIFRSVSQNGAIFLPQHLVAVTPEGCITLPFPIEKINSILALKEEDPANRLDDLPHAILKRLVDDDSSEAEFLITTYGFHEPIQYRPKISDNTVRALMEETQADALSLTKISLETLQSYKESLQETL
ncbi:MAG TPA: hypothetical protein VLH77_00955, partial [Gammaproteobacteria bacterium]|nr:hypothetical protein [Gammaproteobacteria bacterium]